MRFNKRGISGIIVTVLLILLVIISTILIWSLVSHFFSQQNQVIEAKQELLTQEVVLNNVLGPDPDGNVTLLIYRGPTSLILNSSLFVQTFPPKVEIFSVTDLSTSMNCDVSFGGGAQSSYTNQAVCESHGGTWHGPINTAKNANNILIDKILNLSGNNVGLVAFSDAGLENSNPTYFHELSSDSASLKSKVANWIASGSTCTCCGIKKAVESFNYTSANKRLMILMTDGIATQNCSTGYGGGNLNAQQQALYAASQAAANNITINTVGFGTISDENFLREIAETTNGQYYYADINSIADIYGTISSEIIKTYTTEIGNQFLQVVFYNETESGSLRISNPPTEPFETSTYTFISPVQNVTKIEIYLGIILNNGQEITTSSPIDVWEFSD